MATHEPTVEPSTRVVDAVAARRGVPQDALPALYDAVDSDALDRLIAHASTHTDTGVRVTFEYGGCEVSVDGDGELDVVERSSGH
jgi:hypothetical protein